MATKETRTKKELKRLLEIFKDLDENTMSVMDGLIKRAAYMRVTLEDYEKDLDENGYVEGFKQSESLDAYERVRPVANLYNTMNKNYQSMIKMLTDKLPSKEGNAVADEINSFLMGGKK